MITLKNSRYRVRNFTKLCQITALVSMEKLGKLGFCHLLKGQNACAGKIMLFCFIVKIELTFQKTEKLTLRKKSHSIKRCFVKKNKRFNVKRTLHVLSRRTKKSNKLVFLEKPTDIVVEYMEILIKQLQNQTTKLIRKASYRRKGKLKLWKLNPKLL